MKSKKVETKKINQKSKLNLWKIIISVILGSFLTASSGFFLAYTLKVFDKKEGVKKSSGKEISLTAFENKLNSASHDPLDQVYLQDVVFKPLSHELVFKSIDEGKVHNYKVYISEQAMSQYSTEVMPPYATPPSTQLRDGVNPPPLPPYQKFHFAQEAKDVKPSFWFDYSNQVSKTEDKNIPLIILGGLSFILPIWFIYSEVKYLHKYKHLVK